MAYYRNYKYHRKKKTGEHNFQLNSGRLNYSNYSELSSVIEKFKKRIQVNEEFLLFLQNFKIKGTQNISLRDKIINNRNNYKKGIKYLLKKELEEQFKEIVMSINVELDEGKRIIGQKSHFENLNFFNVALFEQNMNEIISKTENTIKNYQKDIEILSKEFASQSVKHERKKKIELEKLEKEKKKIQKEEEIKGLANQTKEKNRQLGVTIKSKIELSKYCPYCGDLIIDPHVDHIYPVSKGGLSTTKNMVMVCSSCNFKKRDLTLNQFIKKFDYDREFIEGNLDDLKKSY